jgi:site-specific DNA recombinase
MIRRQGGVFMKAEKVQASPRPKEVGIWIRVSTEDQAKGESPEHHEKRARYYAESKGWRVIEVYHLEAVSGKSVKDHPECQRMQNDIKRGHISGLIFSKLARLARNTRELLDFADYFREHEADLISLQESIDTSSPAGRLFYTMIAAMAEWERDEIASRVAASVPIRAKLGKPLGGAAPFGYRWENKQLVPDTEEGPVRRRMYELFLQHRRKKTVARLLNEAGHRTRKGSKFSDTTIERLLRDPTAKGLRRANYTKSLGQKKQWQLKPEKDWVWSDVEALVTDEVWEQCNLILDANGNGRRKGKIPATLFAGLTFCVCGTKMYRPFNTPKYVCYKCRNKIPVDDLEAVFQEQLKGFLLSPEEMTQYFSEADNTIAGKQDLLKSLQSEQQRVKQEMDQVYRLYLDGGVTSQGFKAKNDPLEQRFNQLDDQIPELQGEIDFLKIRFLSTDQVLTDAQSFYAKWPDLDSSSKRQVVENIVEKITIGKDDVAIELCYLPSSSEDVTQRQRNFKGSWRRPA